jgi:hypothetical protein
VNLIIKQSISTSINMSSPKATESKKQQALTVDILDSEPDSPSVQPTVRSSTFGAEGTSNYEACEDDTHSPPASHTILREDPFSNESSRILFESIGALLANLREIDQPSNNSIRPASKMRCRTRPRSASGKQVQNCSRVNFLTSV